MLLQIQIAALDFIRSFDSIVLHRESSWALFCIRHYGGKIASHAQAPCRPDQV
jgi:hypothetical protein